MEALFKRPLIMFTIAFAVGVYAAGEVHSLLLSVVFGLILATWLILAVRFLNAGKLMACVIIVFYLAGSIAFTICNNGISKAYNEYDQQLVKITGTVVSDPEITESRITWEIKPVLVEALAIKGPDPTIRNMGKIFLATNSTTSINIEYGSEVVFEGKLSKPSGIRNPGGFDFSRYLYQRGIAARVFSIYIEEGKEQDEGEGFLYSMQAAGRQIRHKIAGVFEVCLPPQQAGLMSGILIGYRDGLGDYEEEAFSIAGLTHIMAVSGANLAFILLPVSLLFKKLRIPQRVAKLLLIMVIIAFVFITGAEPSVVRASIMACVILIGGILFKEPDTLSAIAFSAFVMLFVNPFILYNIGFQLSFAATAAIVVLTGYIKVLLAFTKLPGRIRDVASVTIAAQLGVLPILIFTFNKISVISLITNLLVVPVLELVTVLGAAMAVVGQFWMWGAQLIGYANCVLLSFILYVVQFSTQFSFAMVRVVTPSLLYVLVYYPLLFQFLRISTDSGYRENFMKNIKQMESLKLVKTLKLQKPLNLIQLAAGVVIVSMLIILPLFLPKSLEAVFLDVGEGDCCYIETAGRRRVLVDGGGSADGGVSADIDEKSQIGESVVLPFLMDKRASRLDVVIATHGHNDHVEGLYTVLQSVDVGLLVIPETLDKSGLNELIEIAGRRGIPVEECSAGDILRLDNKTFLRVLSPNKDQALSQSTLNNTSLVIKLCYDEFSILFMGDAEKEIEQQILDGGTDISADVIKISHHGSSTSTTDSLIKLVNPYAAIISVGSNKFGHPSSKVLKILENEKIQIFRTDEAGAIVLTKGQRKIKIKKTTLNRKQ